MATLSPSNSHPQRLPPPSLFLGPPSRNASDVSLINSSANTTAPKKPPRATLLRSRSARGPEPSSSSLFRTMNHPTLSTTQTERDRTDALWAEMQATLAEVEVSAFSSTHMFGAAHAEALEGLRGAQIGLAQAWGRDVGDVGEERGEDGGDVEAKREEDEDADERDIFVARRKREANERFFEKVREGVKDVVGRLETVADAMRKVERESREIWSTSQSCESVASGSANS